MRVAAGGAMRVLRYEMRGTGASAQVVRDGAPDLAGVERVRD